MAYLKSFLIWTTFLSIAYLLDELKYVAEAVYVDTGCACGASNNALKNRIFGGVDTTPNEYPWIAAIFDSNHNIYCGGTIISNKHILTAGHCVYYTNPMKLYVMLGLHDRLNRDGIRYDLRKVHLYPEFKAYAFHDGNDVAIMELITLIEFSNKIRPICLPLTQYGDPAYKKAIVAGWGRMWTKGDNSHFLQRTSVIVEPNNRCRNSVIGRMYNPGPMLCAYAKNADACQGDSGGPLFIETGLNHFELLGITSFGIGCGTENAPGVYARASAFLPWIHAVIADATTCDDSHIYKKNVPN